MLEFHPGFILLLGGLIAALVPKRLRQVVMVGTPFLAIIATLSLQVGTQWKYLFINNMELIVLKADRLSLLFAFVFSILALLGSIYALHIDRPGETMAALFYAGSSLNVIFAGDWLTLILFWEIMAISSVFLIWNRRRPQSLAAGFRYILIHLLGGSLLLAGIFLQVSGGQLAITSLTGMQGWAYWLILLGISINAAIPPLHVWLTDAYPEATLTGSVFLCALTTKTAVYCLIRIFPGTRLLLWLGVIMAIYGVIYAILENDIRRLLSYHIVSQIGFMVAGVGIGTELALNGAAAHAYSHILYKALLFMGAGAVIYATGYEKLTELGGLYRKMPLTAIFFSIGAFSISGLPLFNGFISKSIITSAAAINQMPAAELLLTLASVGTFLSIALKLNYFMFFGPEREIKVKKIPFNMSVAMAGLSFLCVLYGVCPQLLYNRLPFAIDYVPYTFDHVISTLQLVLAVFMVFWVLRSRLLPHNAISLDFDWFYREPFAAFMVWLVRVICKIKDGFGVQGNIALAKVIPFFKNPVKWLPQTIEGPVSAIYDEDKYRLPVGVAVLMGAIVFVLMLSYAWF
ncbi:MAG: Na(+)/H(+) antiporter subunit D [Peptococcia bacterium]|jgi:multicomponent Na+:H+ antiporter subunit D